MPTSWQYWMVAAADMSVNVHHHFRRAATKPRPGNHAWSIQERLNTMPERKRYLWQDACNDRLCSGIALSAQLEHFHSYYEPIK
jgi:hypothetical protein